MKRKTPRKEKRQKKKKKTHSQKKVYSHPVYGNIPMIHDSYWKCDPNFKPKLPIGAVRGDVSQQEFCDWCHLPKYFYVDESKECVDCEKKFTFSASEQKYWYETRKFHFSSEPIRCLACRKEIRSEKALKKKMMKISEELDKNPKSTDVLLRYAQITYDYYRYFNQGNIEKAISTARQAYKINPKLTEALYWEGLCKDAAGFQKGAIETYQQLLSVSSSKKDKKFKDEVQNRLDALFELVSPIEKME
ncbi:MAG: zinc-ribbon domain containing protein [Chloroflexota bacterium]